MMGGHKQGMGSRLLKKTFLWVLLLLAVLCWRLGEAGWREADSSSDFATLRGLTGLTAASRESMIMLEQRAAEPVPFSLWAQVENQRVEALDIGRESHVAVLWVAGNTRLVLPIAQTLAEEDTTGCLIDRQTAQKLFGLADPVGAQILYKDQAYTVRAVMEMKAPTMLLRPQEKNKQPLDSLTLAGGEKGKLFALRHGLSPVLVVKNSSYTQLSQVLAVLPVFTAWLLLLEAVWRWKKSRRAYPVQSLLAMMALYALFTAGLLYGLQLLPDRFIPSRWSDFSFWPSAFAGWREDALALLTAAKTRPELLQISRSLKAWPGILSAGLLLLLRKQAHCQAVVK
ncbi:ABC transporter permease [Oscillospiraceae bacterium MB08-C2-2]|nr:ABC transporter permease [Oscillospiraceae bacterium MB08-C2-2]